MNQTKANREELIELSKELRTKFRTKIRKSSSLQVEEVEKLKHKDYHIKYIARIGYNDKGHPIQNIYVTETPDIETGTKVTLVGDFFDHYFPKINVEADTISLPEFSQLTPRKKAAIIDGQSVTIDEYWLS